MTIKDFGAQVERVWEDLRPMTRKMLVGALQTNAAAAKQKFSYDAHADWELSRLLSALDERVTAPEAKASPENLRETRRMAEACANVLQTQTESAEVFIQLAQRALKRLDYPLLEKLADALNERFSAGEIAEIIRQAPNAMIRALAIEALAMVPITSLLPLLEDPFYAEIAKFALEQQAFEFGSMEARHILAELEMEDLGFE
jgi:hypothetical protein